MQQRQEREERRITPVDAVDRKGTKEEIKKGTKKYREKVMF